MPKVKNKRSKLYIMQIFILALIVAACKFIGESTFAKSKVATKTPTENKVTEKIETINKSDKMIGLWISYLDLKTSNTLNPEQEFKSKYQNMIKSAIENNINTLIVQVRPFSDALYPSKIYPWSHILTGNQGQNPGFDPLKYMVEVTHKNGLKFHAWINPYRISINNIPDKISALNPYNTQETKDSIKYEGGICYNPASKKVQSMITNGVKEIITNYDVDGIHFDDYFYPEHSSAITNDNIYQEYCQKGGKMGIHQWRAKHVNALIKNVYKFIKEINPKVEFGISPSGNFKNCACIGSDIKTWCENEGYVDYICPQIYWSLDFNIMPFEKTAKEWKELIKNQNINLYCGLALYKVGTQADCGTWQNRDDILANEFKISEKLKYNGVALYSYAQLCSKEAEKEMQNLKKEFAKIGSN